MGTECDPENYQRIVKLDVGNPPISRTPLWYVGADKWVRSFFVADSSGGRKERGQRFRRNSGEGSICEAIRTRQLDEEEMRQRQERVVPGQTAMVVLDLQVSPGPGSSVRSAFRSIR